MNIKVVNAICLQENKLLLVQKGEHWILPGGKLLPNETDQECLIREFAEELPKATIKVGIFYDEFIGVTPHSRRLCLSKAYFAEVTGDIIPAAEISGSGFFSQSECFHLQLSDITGQIVRILGQVKLLR